MKYILILYLLCGLIDSARSQSYSLEQLEQSFLQNNYQLLAARYAIDQQEAKLIQEKLWPNPSLTLDEINLWSNRSSEVLPPMFGQYGSHQQISIELEQLIETAGKRAKRIAIQKLEGQKMRYEFQDLLLELKKQLRQAYYALVFQKENAVQLDRLVTLLLDLQERYAVQRKSGNVSAVAHQRIQAELIQLQREQLVLREDMQSHLQTLSVLTQLPDLQQGQISSAEIRRKPLEEIPLANLSAYLQNNLSVKQQQLAIQTAGQEIDLEKAQAKPDLAVQISYDRGGNIMQNFVGIGISFDIPFFDRNQGQIKMAQYRHQEAKAKDQDVTTQVRTRAELLQQQLINQRQLVQEWEELWPEPLEASLNRYEKHLRSGQLSLIEFIDLVQAVRQARQDFVDTQSAYHSTLEELKQLCGGNLEPMTIEN